MRFSHVQVMIPIFAGSLLWTALTAHGEDLVFSIMKDQSYAAAIPVNVGSVAKDARYVRFMMQVPEGTELDLYAIEGRGDGELWVLDTRVLILTGDKTEYYFPFTEEIGRPGWAVDTSDAQAIVVSMRTLETSGRKDAPKGDGKLDPTAVDKLLFILRGTNGVDMLGAGMYRVEGLQFVKTSPFEKAIENLHEVNITVDANQSLGRVNPFWRDLFLSNEITAKLPQRAVRIPVFGIVRAFPQDGPNGKFKWDEADAMVEQAKKHGTFVIQIVGRDVPRWLWDADRPESDTYVWSGWKAGNLMPPVDLKAYGELEYKMAKHFNVDKKYGIKYFEFWTEPDGWSWYRGPLSTYVRMYEAFARGVKRADPKAKVGCPGLANYNIHWWRVILDYCTKHDVPLDFASFHHYGSHASAFGDHIAHFRNMVAGEFPKFKNVEILWSEWNNQIVPYKEAIAFKRTAADAAFAADCIKHMADQRVDMATFSYVPDDPNLWVGLGLFLDDQKTPKPVYNTLRAFAAMEGTDAERVRAETGADEILGLNAFATKAKEHVAVCVWWNLEIPDPANLSRRGKITVSGIPFSGDAVLKRYLIDETRSNFKAGPAHRDLEAVEEKRVTVMDGKLEIPLEANVSTVQLFKIRPK